MIRIEFGDLVMARALWLPHEPVFLYFPGGIPPGYIAAGYSHDPKTGAPQLGFIIWPVTPDLLKKARQLREQYGLWPPVTYTFKEVD